MSHWDQFVYGLCWGGGFMASAFIASMFVGALWGFIQKYEDKV